MKLIIIALLTVSASAFKLPESQIETKSKIVDGTLATRGEFPYIIDLRKRDRHYCGGAIYNDRWVLTAAHCLNDQFELYTVVAGELNLADISGDEQLISINKYFKHPKYSPINLSNDIGLIRLNNSLILNDVVKAIPLKMEKIEIGYVTVAGWGSIHGSEMNFPDNLHRVDMPIVTDSECQSVIGSMVRDSNICAGFMEGGESSCYGDSGGPLITKDGNSHILTGLVSFGPSVCGTPNKFSVYSEIAYYTDWIETTVMKNY